MLRGQGARVMTHSMGIREYAWFVPGDHWRYSQHCGYRLGFYRIGKYMLIDTKWCWEISEFGSITACNGQPICLLGAAAGGSFLCSLGITMLLLHAQQRQKRAKDWHQWDKYMLCYSLCSVDRDWAPCYSCWLLLVLCFWCFSGIPH